ncbi:MAG: sulfotransferase [Caldilineaceae bacterium]|nr:sulfotransferase [Caldilineaceae bacterium]
MQSYHYIFIGGVHRSGTSLLFQILRAHPAISGFWNTGVDEDEGQFLQSVYPIARRYGGPGQFGFAPAAHLTELSPLVNRANAQKLMDEWGRYWQLDRPFLLEKSPPNLLKSRFLQALFPASSFLMVVRHPVAVTYATRKWVSRRVSLYRLFHHWVLCHEKFAADCRQLHNVLVVHYEALVTEPQATLHRIYHFLGLETMPITQVIQPHRDEPYFLRWQQLQQGRFSRFYARAIMTSFEQRINRFGYSLRSYAAGQERTDLPNLSGFGPHQTTA